jgi:ketol-acid reductoisomerase
MNKKIVDKIEFLKKLGFDAEPQINKLLDKKIDEIVEEIKGGSFSRRTKSPSSKPSKKESREPEQRKRKKSNLGKPEEKVIPMEEETTTEVG